MRATDRRIVGILGTLLAVLAGGAWIGAAGPTHPVELVGTTGQVLNAMKPQWPLDDPGKDADLRRRFAVAVEMLQKGHHESAALAWQQVLEIAPLMPEAHVNMGYALLGMRHYKIALRYFERATELNTNQANAYYGMALAHEAGGDLELSLGAMRSYLHLARGEDQERLRRARAAVWEWESKLGALRKRPKP